jgi:hypothetical protein
MIVIENITFELDTYSKDETRNVFQIVLLGGFSVLVLLAGLAIQRRLGIFLKNHDSRIINKIIQTHRVSMHI